MITVYCVVCAEKIQTYRSHLQTGQAQYTCMDCKDLVQKKFSHEERREIHKVDKDAFTPQPKLKPQRIPVLAENLPDFVRWLVRHKYSRRDYEFCELNVPLKTYGSKIFVLLKSGKNRTDWKAVNAYFMEHTPSLIVE